MGALDAKRWLEEKLVPGCGLSSKSSWEHPTVAQSGQGTHRFTPTALTGALTLHTQGQESCTGLSSSVKLADPHLDKALHGLLPGEHPFSPLLSAVQRLEAETKGLEHHEQRSDFILQATGSQKGSKVAWSDLGFDRLLREECSSVSGTAVCGEGQWGLG